jgi:hypothetical protein
MGGVQNWNALTKNIDHGLIHDMEHSQKIQYKHAKDCNGDLVLWFVIQDLFGSATILVPHRLFNSRHILEEQLFGVAKKPFLDCHFLQTPFGASHEVAFCFLECPCSLTEIIGIVTYIPTLSLNFAMLCQHGFNEIACYGLSHFQRVSFDQPWDHIPSEKLLMASIFRCLERYDNVTSGDPSLIIRWTVIKLLNTTVHVESRSRFCNARNTSATPCSPE